MRKHFSITLVVLLLFSCVSQDKYDKLNDEKVALQEELRELKFGAPNLLSDAKKFFQSKDYVQAREKLQTLLEKHPDRPESAEAKSMLSTINEEESWINALNSPDINSTNNYLSQYPEGKYVALAKRRLGELKVAKERSEYDYAVTQNTSSAWKNFIANYPNRQDIDEIKKRIIKCEVDEIMEDRETGKLPSFDQTSFEYSSSSAVSITNDTGCELTVRYSGEDVKMIEIPADDTRTVYLQSGNYRIAASACGTNYAGTEALRGNYSCKYYINTYRY
jgi:outer membrane protein assembly factor BamD (BamD/ComL family)